MRRYSLKAKNSYTVMSQATKFLGRPSTRGQLCPSKDQVSGSMENLAELQQHWRKLRELNLRNKSPDRMKIFEECTELALSQDQEARVQSPHCTHTDFLRGVPF
jgi:hypothetical protein